MKAKALFFVVTLFITNGLIAQGFGELQVKVSDELGLALPGALVRIDGGATVRGDITDLDGRMRMGSLPPGSYTVEFVMTGKQRVRYNDVRVNTDQITRLLSVVMRDSVVNAIGTGPEIFGYRDPLINDDGGTVVMIRAKDLKNMSSANGGNIKQIVASLSSDIKVSPSGDELYFRGSRSGSVLYFIDGVKIRVNAPNVPSSGISSIAVYTGGVPAKYGDSTGGYIIVETKSYLEDYYEKLNRAQ